MRKTPHAPDESALRGLDEFASEAQTASQGGGSRSTDPRRRPAPAAAPASARRVVELSAGAGGGRAYALRSRRAVITYMFLVGVALVAGLLTSMTLDRFERVATVAPPTIGSPAADSDRLPDVQPDRRAPVPEAAANDAIPPGTAPPPRAPAAAPAASPSLATTLPERGVRASGAPVSTPPPPPERSTAPPPARDLPGGPARDGTSESTPAPVVRAGPERGEEPRPPAATAPGIAPELRATPMPSAVERSPGDEVPGADPGPSVAPPEAAVVDPAVRPGAPDSPDLETDGRAIRAVLEHYRTALSALDASAALEAWPTVDARALARAFDGLEAQEVSFESCQVDASESTALAYCEGTVRYVPRVGRQTLRWEPRHWTFTLHRAGAGWLIESVEARED